WENVRELIAAAAAASEVLEDDDSTPLERFLAQAALLTGQDKVEGQAGGVTLMTVHTAKGLEWPVVAVAGLEDGLFPLARSLDQASTAAEERRLCYVAVTRARDKLYLSWARSRRRGGEIRPGVPSRFLRALPAEVVEERRTSSLWAPPRVRESGRRRAVAGVDPGTTWSSHTLVEIENQDGPRYVKGERVRHRRFGTGTIEGLVGAGRNLKVTVRFDDEAVGRKQLVVQYAGLERVWEEA
ncbi:MAG: ATP-binding domain-containing protein, partial [Firmicutes bacterium]|nr:ATP-binding domain-containing protein [Bacillota bacterium]